MKQVWTSCVPRSREYIVFSEYPWQHRKNGELMGLHRALAAAPDFWGGRTDPVG